MAQQGTLIYIEKNNTTEAEFMSRTFINRDIKNRAYLNTLGAELVSKYLESEGFDMSETHNIHSVSKILEEIDIADILLSNIHIDVRVVFDKKQIFIPKSHFNLQIVPDIYAVVKIDDNFKHAEFLGYFKSSAIDKTNQNSDYYFVSEKALSSPDTLTKFIKDFPGKVQHPLSEEDFLKGRELSVSLSDHNITEDEKIELLQLLLSDSALRESVIEFDNFETLSYSAAPELENLIEEVAPATTGLETTTTEDVSINEEEEELVIDEEIEDEIQETESEDEELIEEDEISETTEETLEEELVIDDIQDESEIVEEELELQETSLDDEKDTKEETTINELDVEDISIEEESIQETEALNIDIQPEQQLLDDENNIDTILDMGNVDLGDDMLGADIMDETLSLPEENISLPAVEEFHEEIETSEVQTTEEETTITATAEKENTKEDIKTEPVLSVEPVKIEPVVIPQTNLSVDAILDQTIAAIGETTVAATTATAATVSVTTETLTNALTTQKEEIQTGNSEEIPSDEETTDETVEEDEITDELTEEIDNEVSDEAMKLASVSGDLISNVVNENIEKQQKRLDRIDYAKTDIAPDTKEIPEHIQALGTLSIAKQDANIEAEVSGQFDSPTDLSELNSVEIYKEEIFEQETVDIDNMETVALEEFSENTSEIVNLSDIDDIDSPTKPVENLDLMDQDSEIKGMDLPDTSSFTINEDGTSSIDNLDMDLNFDEANGEENLVDIGIKMNLNEISLDDDSNAFDLGGMENINDEEHLSELPGMNNFAIDSEPTDTVEEFTSQEEEIIIEDNETETEETADSLFDEISLEDFEALTENSDENSEGEDLIDNEFDSEEPPIEDKTQSTQDEAQDWLEDTSYDNLQDVENDTISEEDLISEPVANSPQEIDAIDNSTIISDKNFTPREIPIDINNPQERNFEGSESLESIYNPESKVPGEALLKNPGRLSTNRQNKSGLGVGLGIAGTLIALALVGVIGFSVAKMFKTPNQDNPQPITDDALPTSSDNGVSDSNTLNVDPNNVVNMDENSNIASQGQQAAKTEQQAPAAKKMPTTSFIEVKKLTWEVPDYISYNPQFKQYFQSVGKSLKLSLASDLLLANDPIFSNQVRVSVTFEKDGTFKTSQIIVSSGSTQVDKIVLQTVNDTLKSFKAPNSVGNDESTTVILKLYL